MKAQVFLRLAFGCNVALIGLGIVGIIRADHIEDEVAVLYYAAAAALIFWSAALAAAYFIAERRSR